MFTVPLNGDHARGRVATVDDADAELVRPYSWHVLERRRRDGSARLYAAAYIGGGRANSQHVLLHRLLMPGIPEIDHWDGDGLNCQRWNLRPATRSQNNANARKRSHVGAQPPTSCWKGVSWRGDRGKWRAYLVVGGRQQSLGQFTSEIDAARAYDAAAREAFGAFARLNFPDVR